MQLMTVSTRLAKVRPAANSTDSSFPSRVPTATEPSGDGVIEMRGRGAFGQPVQNAILLVPYCVGADNDTFNVRVFGWRRIGTDHETDTWVPVLIAQFACTAGAIVGVAGTQVVATERFCDTIAKTYGADGDMTIVSPAADLIASVLVDFKGAEKVEVMFDIATGPTEMNCLYGLM